MTSNTLGEFSDGEDDFVFQINENLCDGNVWSDPEADDLIRNINEEEILAYGNDNDENEIQTGRGEKRKNESDVESESEDEQSEDEQGQYYYQLESRRKYHSKKFGMTATDHRVRFNNVLADRDLLESYETTHKIFHHLLEDVKEGMAPNDQVRFILRSDQLETPISLPFMTVERLTAERVYSELERVIQSNQEFRLNDTVTIDLNHVLAPAGSGRKKRTTYNIDDYLSEKGSVVRIKNKDDLCLARALVVARAKEDNDPRYNYIKDSRRPLQREKAFDLHEAANVPLGPCGLNEVALFQQYLSDYQIVILSGDHNNSIIYPPQSSGTDEKPRLTLYLHDNHFDVITTVPGFLGRVYFCFRCYKPYDHTTETKTAAITTCYFSILKLRRSTVHISLIYVLFTMKRKRWHYFKGKIPSRIFASGYLPLSTKDVLWLLIIFKDTMGILSPIISFRMLSNTRLFTVVQRVLR